MARPEKIRLGDLLIQQGLLNDEQLKFALDEQKRSGRKLGIIGDLPGGVLWQWRRWCLNPNYGMGVEGEWVAEAYAAAHYPLHALYFEDDEMMSLASVQSLVGWYKSAPSFLEHVNPAIAPKARIGHMGYFREEMRELLWRPLLPLLQSWSQGDRSPGKPLFGPQESPA